MSWLHAHRWVEHARTWAPPVDIGRLKEVNGLIWQQSMTGVTTFVFRCDDERCGALKTLEVLGDVKGTN